MRRRSQVAGRHKARRRVPAAAVVVLLCVSAAVRNGIAQEQAASLPEDSLRLSGPAAHSVSGAVIRSSLLPGWGQWYNGKKLKALAVFGGEAVLIGTAVIQNQRAVQSRTEAERTFYQDDRSRFLWYAAALWLLNVVDAHVDAKLKDFDISEKLSLRSSLDPQGLCSMGITYSF